MYFFKMRANRFGCDTFTTTDSWMDGRCLLCLMHFALLQ